MSYILRLCKGYLPGKGYVIYSPGTAPRTTYIKLFIFRYSIVMQEKIALNWCERPFFFLIKRFFFQVARGRIIGFTARAFQTDANVRACNLFNRRFLETMGEMYLQGRRTAKTQGVCLELGPLCSILEFPSPSLNAPSPSPAGVIRDLKMRGRRRQRKRLWKSEFAFFQSSSRLLQVTNFVKCRWTLLKVNS